MTDDDKALVERLTAAIKESIGKQFNATPIHPDPNVGDWAASGGVIDLKQVAQSLLPIISDRIEALSAEIERLRVMSLRIADWLRCAPMESGVCCCGDPIEGHGYDSGHSPVDAVQYSAMQLESEIRAALGETK